MHPRDIIERIAALDEATVAEPTVEPTEAPPTERPTERPSRRPSRSPWTMPPDMEPGHEPRPKAEDQSEQIESWLQATQQPVRDWDWDGNELRLALEDGTTEVYTAGQLQEIGIFDGQTAFAESEEGLPFSPDSEFLDGGGEEPCGEGEAMVAMGADEPKESDDSHGTLDMILGRTPTPAAEIGGEEAVQVVQIDGDHAEDVIDAVSDLVKAIIGAASGSEEGEEPKDDDSGADKKPKDKKEDSGKSKKEKKSKDKTEDKDEDKKDDEKDDE